MAVYKNPEERGTRRILRYGLFIFAPTFFIASIVLVIYLTFVSASGEVKPGTATESITMADVPLPIGIREITKTPDSIQSSLANNIISIAMPNYRVVSNQTEIYVIKQSAEELNNYYSKKLVPLQWKQFNQKKLEIDYGATSYVTPSGKNPAPTVDPRTKRNSTFIIYYYTRSTKDPRVYDGLFLRYEQLLNETQLKKRTDLVNRKAEVGDTLIYLSKLQIVQRG
ncbi:hypothetical protein [Candidatus Chlorohelix sp.]|uniref:hypothetical protein n=1 Tax=Candidatus Chlorohelix sp. TaxID=3139201 RepID=UPI003144F698